MAAAFRELTEEDALSRDRARLPQLAAQDALDVLGELAHDCVLLSHATDPSGLLRFHRLRRIIHEISEEVLVCEEKGISNEAIARALSPARSVHASSPLVRRLQEWPRGYPGDFETIDQLARPVNRADKGSIGYLCESYWLASPVAQQIRNRLAEQAAFILERCATPGRVRILSTSCGGCLDLSAILLPLTRMNGYAEFVMVDRDADALTAGRLALQTIEESCQWIENAGAAIPSEAAAAGPYDVVVSGLQFDTLEDREVVAFLRNADRNLLSSGGAIFFSNIAAPNPYRPLLEYITRWILVERSEDDLRRLCSEAQISSDRLSMRRDLTGLAVLGQIRK